MSSPKVSRPLRVPGPQGKGRAAIAASSRHPPVLVNTRFPDPSLQKACVHTLTPHLRAIRELFAFEHVYCLFRMQRLAEALALAQAQTEQPFRLREMQAQIVGSHFSLIVDIRVFHLHTYLLRIHIAGTA